MNDAKQEWSHEPNRQMRLGLVLTGGTIGSEYSVDDVVRIPNVSHDTWGAELELISKAWTAPSELLVHPRQPLRALSENMVPSDWLLIADSVRSLVHHEDVAGVLILHGTDTASYTAAALSFLLNDLDTPVVITGSNLPPEQAGSDALKNIGDALVAIQELRGGVYLSFAGDPNLPSYIHLGTCVRKVRASGQAFFSINRPPLSRVIRGQYEVVSSIPSRESVTIHCSGVDSRVLGIRLYPGLDFEAVWSAIERTDIRGCVVELYASATGPDVAGHFSLPAFVKRCFDARIAVVGTLTESAAEKVNLYESSIAIAEAGAILLDDVLPETAIVKLMWALSAISDPEEINKVMSASLAGERARRQ